MLTCPACHKETLVTREVTDCNFTVEECSQCKGLWFDRGELEDVLGKLAAENPEPRPGKVIPLRVCPRCRRIMLSFNYPGTFAKIEMCRQCGGFWLDDRELEEIITVRRYRLTHPVEKETETAQPKSEYWQPEQDDGRPDGLKGALLKMVNTAIDKLSAF